jgi:hypothetical protein
LPAEQQKEIAQIIANQQNKTRKKIRVEKRFARHSKMLD